ncbi:hypothetical protein [Streptomyces sp. NPDC053367]|uniref:hypothetical protein n=1 Tax=Streptomyces sp. NPDC053367 TaxID=3365700 RepID=UPI0037D8534B
MTRQTAAPFDHISLNPTHVTLGELVRRIDGGMLDLEPPSTAYTPTARTTIPPGVVVTM